MWFAGLLSAVSPGPGSRPVRLLPVNEVGQAASEDAAPHAHPLRTDPRSPWVPTAQVTWAARRCSLAISTLARTPLPSPSAGPGEMPANGEAAEAPPPVRGEGGRRRGGVALHGNDAGPKMAAAGVGAAGGPGAGPRGRWGGCLWVRGVLLVLGGLPAGAAAAPISLSTSPPCRHHVPSDTEVGGSGVRAGRARECRINTEGVASAAPARPAAAGALREKASARAAVGPCSGQSA